MIVFECPACQKKLQVAAEHVGKNIACPNCKTKMTVPTPSPATPPLDTARLLDAKTQLVPPPSDTAHILYQKTQLASLPAAPSVAPATQPHPEAMKKTQLASDSPVTPTATAKPEGMKKTQLAPAPAPSTPAVRPPARPRTKSQGMSRSVIAASGLVVLSVCILAIAIGLVLWNQKASDPIAKGKADGFVKKEELPGPKVNDKKENELIQPKAGDLIANDLGMKFAWIPPGSFLMGSPANEKDREHYETQHRVNLTKGFRMGIHTVTKAQWRTVMGTNPNNFKGDDLPVETASWNDCVEFCTKLSKRESKNYRLPTEAEWEYACRAGSQTAYHFGDDPSNLGDYAWFRENTNVNPHPVGQKKPNSWGLYDMHGNVWQWCEDWWDGDYYSNSPGDNPVNTKATLYRVARGGSWAFSPRYCRSAFRQNFSPGNRGDGFGFRVVLSLP